MDLKSIVKAIGSENTQTLVDEQCSADVTEYIDTGSYTLNALLSASLYGGVPGNKITQFAGESSTGKTFFVMDILAHYHRMFPDAIIHFADSEFTNGKKIFEDHGIDINRIILSQPDTVEEWKNLLWKLLTNYTSTKGKKPRMISVLDSLANLSTDKEIEDTKEEKVSQDMTRQKRIREAFRVLCRKLGKANVPLLLTNHVYDSPSLYSGKNISGGGGTIYNSSSIIMLSKRKDLDGKEVTGNIITCLAKKNRFAKENAKVEVKLTYSKGLDRYYGLIDLGLEGGIFEKSGNKVKWPDGSTHFEKSVYKNPTKFFTPDIMSRLEITAKAKFSYGSVIEGDEDDNGEEDS